VTTRRKSERAGCKHDISERGKVYSHERVRSEHIQIFLRPSKISHTTKQWRKTAA
jgi:hypothetical protein